MPTNESPENSEIQQFDEHHLDLQRREMALEEVEAERNYNFALKAIEYQHADRERTFNWVNEILTKFMKHIIVLFGMLFFLIGFTLYMCSEEVVIEIIKLGFAFLGGGGIGWGVRNATSKTSSQNSEEIVDE